MDQPQTTPPINPLLDRVRMPGETFTLPSGGLFYKDGELDDSVTNAEVLVYPMTAVDEIALKTPDLLFSGKAVEQVFMRCIPQVKNSGKLFVKDVDFLLTVLRKLSYGNEMRIEYKHDCKDAGVNQYTVDVQTFIRDAKRIDPTEIGSKFTIELENGQNVKLQPIRFEEFVKLMQRMDNQKDISPEEARDDMVDSVSGVILAVDEVTDHDMIKEWLSAAPPKFLAKINESVEDTAKWGPKFNVSTVCVDCGKPINFTAPLNPLSFFT